MYIDNTKFVSRTLEDILPDLPKVAKGEHYFVGSKSSYFMCFKTVEEYEGIVDAINLGLLGRSKSIAERAKASLANVKRPVRTPGESDEDFKKRMNIYKTRKADLKRTIEIWTDYVANYVPLRQRKVREVFVRNGLDHSCCILIEGEEAGMYIDYSEFKKLRNPKPKLKKVEAPKGAVPVGLKEGVYLGKRKPISKLKDYAYDVPYIGKLPKGLGNLYRTYVDSDIALYNLASVARISRHKLRLLFYKIQTGEIEI
jgi:hypothetical protein